MSQVLFPTLRGLSWSVHKKPTMSTRTSKHVSGRTVRLQLYSWPLWAFELEYDALFSDKDRQDLQTLMSFFIARGGSFDSFLFEDPSDHQAKGQLLGAGNGSNQVFTFLHPLSAAIGAPVGQVDTEGLNVSVNGVLLPASAYTVTLPATLSLHAVPAAGVQVTADYHYWFACCFDDDQQDYENFMYQLWELQSCKFTSVKP